MSILFSPLDKTSSSKINLRDQLCARISYYITQGLLEPGMRLPSCRKASLQLGISRNTVVSAYQNLIYDGMVESRERSGYFVHQTARANPYPQPQSSAKPGSIKYLSLFERLSPSARPSIYDTVLRPTDWASQPYPFVCNQMDAARFPLADWRKCSFQVLNRSQTAAVTSDYLYGDCEELVAQIRNRLLPRRGIYANEDEILITAGAQQAIYITAMLFGGPDRKIACEDPCYPDARNIFHLFFGGIEAIELDNQGLICDERLSGCNLVYVTPNHQYPTAVRMSKARRAELHAQAERHNLIIIEDDYDCETDFDPLNEPALKSHAQSDHVIYIGTLSKSLSPGLRLGYVVGTPDFIREARAMRGMMIRHPPPIMQLTSAQFIRLGHHDALISRLQGIYERRWYTANAALHEHFPDADITSGWGGTNFLVTLPDTVDLTGFTERALQSGVVIDHIKPCYMRPEESHNKFRLGVSAIGTKKITAGIAKLRAIYDDFIVQP
ncbi:MAG: PLP-dependent aminotransferase family protein [Magnetovibrio sp.]|nr:PLP-dependent aminotransferase family protein [Magnetovibrio sp.]